MKIRIKIPQNRPDKNSRFGRLLDQVLRGLSGVLVFIRIFEVPKIGNFYQRSGLFKYRGQIRRRLFIWYGEGRKNLNYIFPYCDTTTTTIPLTQRNMMILI